ncbi:MAG: YjbE family putative metal transport protein [Betaproteobacteria bacterium]|nr:YjbE family putative metal transport protein [Betaproteobacteria bacterium]MDE2212344.1 YjbE family putative metal transport protein [Betaproteobacteria bacterium]
MWARSSLPGLPRLDNLAQTGFWVALAQIISIDLVMSGDNAAVIALAARDLVGRQRHMAVLLGSLGAVVLRVLLTLVAAELLVLSYVQTVGSLLLLWVAYRLVLPSRRAAPGEEVRQRGLGEAVRAIVVADVVMSLDNILGLAAVARGNLLLLTIGLAISILLIVLGSGVLMHFMKRYPVIVVLGGALLGYVAGDMLLSDPAWAAVHWVHQSWLHNGLPVMLAVLIALLGLRRPA